ncbi:MAG: hypothetical protein K6U74_02645 [Firmicutes bacterium]|nr:hypothetical protein [Bacillota bacterium]
MSLLKLVRGSACNLTFYITRDSGYKPQCLKFYFKQRLQRIDAQLAPFSGPFISGGSVDQVGGGIRRTRAKKTARDPARWPTPSRGGPGTWFYLGRRVAKFM